MWTERKDRQKEGQTDMPMLTGAVRNSVNAPNIHILQILKSRLLSIYNSHNKQRLPPSVTLTH
jgi:hypothetical protein